jgi:uncharacterized membrane protein
MFRKDLAYIFVFVIVLLASARSTALIYQADFVIEGAC